jgi:hypothetical protein
MMRQDGRVNRAIAVAFGVWLVVVSVLVTVILAVRWDAWA